MILLDTHVMLWLRAGDRRLGAHVLEEIESAWQRNEISVSAISFWEVAMLRSKGRIAFTEEVALWRREQLAQGVVEAPVNGEIAVRAANLANFHSDPADRFIVATAMQGHTLVTADQRILRWQGNLNRLDARE